MIVWAAASLIGVRVQKPHDVRFARVEFEAFDRDLDLELPACKAPLDFSAAELRSDTGF